MSGGLTLHASCVALGEAGILIRGGSGSGKSTLARRLVDEARLLHRFARLVADDRVRVSEAGGRLVARPVESIAGLVEVRGVGLVPAPFEAAAVLRIVVDCTSRPPRMPEAEDSWALIGTVRLPRLVHAPGSEAARLLLLQEDGIEMVAFKTRS